MRNNWILTRVETALFIAGVTLLTGGLCGRQPSDDWREPKLDARLARLRLRFAATVCIRPRQPRCGFLATPFGSSSGRGFFVKKSANRRHRASKLGVICVL